MTNRIIKKSHFAKSKILLIILCILGLVFSYSCNCRNNSTAPVDNGGGTNTNNIIPQSDPNIFSLTEDEATNQANNILVYSSKLQRTNSLVIVKFNEQATKNFTATLKVLNDGGTGLTADMLAYDTGNGRLTLKEDATTGKSEGLDKVKLLTAGEIKTVKIEFAFKPTKSGLTIEGQTTFTNDIQFTKTKEVDRTSYETTLRKLGGGGILQFASASGKNDAVFALSTLTVEDAKATIKTSGEADIGEIKTSAFRSAFNNDIKTRDLGDFSKVEIINDGAINGTVTTFSVKFTLKDKSREFKSGFDGDLPLNADLKANYDKHPTSVKWIN